MSKIFISYRRDDSNDSTGRIFDRLKTRYGINQLVRDVDSIPTGIDFREYLANEVNRCQVLLAVIGRHWVDVKDAKGMRRLDDPKDLVRIEIETALQRNIPIVPVIVGGAQFPDEKVLPPSIKGLVNRNGVFVRPDPDFHQDVDRLISSLDAVLKTVGKGKPSTTVKAAGGKGGLAVAGLALAGLLLLVCAGVGVFAFLKLRPTSTTVIENKDADQKDKDANKSVVNNGSRGVSKSVRQQAMAWIRENNKWSPTAPIVAKTAPAVEDEKQQCFLVIVGGTLVKSKKTTIFAGRGHGFFLFELTDAQAQPFLPGSQVTLTATDENVHPTSPDIELSSVRLENSDHYTGGPLRGSVQYTRRVKRDGKFTARSIYYSGRRKDWVTIKEPVLLPADQGTLSLEGKGGLNADAGPVLIFIELIDDSDKNHRIVSNTVAGVVTVD
jgi:hypothetical protein